MGVLEHIADALTYAEEYLLRRRSFTEVLVARTIKRVHPPGGCLRS